MFHLLQGERGRRREGVAPGRIARRFLAEQHLQRLNDELDV